jgi:aldehyde:ferredoxin oxidoreductase
MARAVTGWDLNLWELMKAGERRLNMMRAFNAREGSARQQDVLPPKLAEPREGGPSDGYLFEPAELERAKDTYYAMSGWNADGIPTRAKLEELGIGWVADQLSLP